MTPRWMIITLLVSAALNFFLIGVGATVLVVGARMAKARQMAPVPAAAVRRAALALPAGTPREGFAAVVRQAATAEAANLLQVRQARTEAWTAMGAASVDPAALKAKLDTARAAEIASRQHIDNAVIDYLARLPQAQRQAAAEELAPQSVLRRGAQR